MGQTNVVLVTFEGLKVPRYVRFHGAELRCYPHRPRQLVCKICHRLDPNTSKRKTFQQLHILMHEYRDDPDLLLTELEHQFNPIGPPPQYPGYRYVGEENELLDADITPDEGGIVKNMNLALGKVFSVRALRERLDLLMAQFLANDRASLRKSGTEEEYDEKERLLQEICSLARDFGYKNKSRKAQSSAGQRVSGVVTRDTAAATLVPASQVTSVRSDKDNR
ncbi:hypothetical protein MRX96_004587 [Rhipicephalus microplus]